MALQITTAYARRATEYAEQLGSMTSVHPLDLQLVTGWADRLDDPAIDAGCGPGHWTGPMGRSWLAFPRERIPPLAFRANDKEL
ncbi:hypothetical protein [Cryobacterium sp. TMT4-31]|uniref:hypothetical protein n=1 Tax=Cryobacterium sp. TMT4-31 TaxID=1259259 RepID=UPI00106D5643|nr:hypothetical protein [Cryobacterium sp. TMT4-31]